MAKNDLPPAEVLRQLLEYDEDTGLLFWKERGPELFGLARLHSAWNTRRAGREAFTAINSSGYRYGKIGGATERAHIIAWVIAHGAPPVGCIDHINHIRTDNRLVNLREVTKRENHLNMKISAANTSGVTGVVRNRNRWQAVIGVHGRTVYLGRFTTLEEAAAVRRAAEVEHGFHKNHGT